MYFEKPKIKALSINEALTLEKYRKFKIQLKYDGTLMFFDGRNLFSDRKIIRNDRFRHIHKLLIENNFNACAGEIFLPCNIENGERTCVFDVSSKENWDNVAYCVFEVSNEIDKQKILSLQNPLLILPMEFKTIKEGWDFAEKQNQEGLVIIDLNTNEKFKIKRLYEVKEPIVKHEAGSVKGCFVLKSGNRVSGTSESFVRQFKEIKLQNKEAIAEIEFAFLSENNKYFQPRLRQITIEG